MSRREIYRKDRLSVFFTFVGEDQVHATVSVMERPADASLVCEEAYRQIADLLTREDMQIVHERVFGSLEARSAVVAARSRALSAGGIGQDGPITYVQGRPLWGEGLAGVELHAVRPERAEDVWTIYDEGVPCGRGWLRAGAKFLVLQSVHGLQEGAAADADRGSQARGMLERTSKILRSQGAAYGDIVQTWIYLSAILEWYDEFNQARNVEYRKLGLISERPGVAGVEKLPLPASTGIEGDNPLGAASVMDLLAIVGEAGVRPEVTYLSNVKQTEAFAYGSAFSRGACIREPDVTHIQVSGTAAINEQGQSLFPGDVRAQIVQTIETVEALIAQQGATLHDICEATVFLKRPEDASVYQQVIAERGLADMPAVCVIGDVCRAELLFEMDGAAALDRMERPES